MPDFYRLTFTLPPALRLGVLIGRHQPCLHGCVLWVSATFEIAIEGPFRARVFDQARSFLTVHARGHGECSIRALLKSPGPGRGQDTIWIVTGAEVSFSTTPIEPDISSPAVVVDDPIEQLLAAAALAPAL
jgi:hypothetical protein